MIDEKTYENLYKTTSYGDASKDRCPGARFFPLYKHHLKPVVMDFGCGNGDTVHLIREAGIPADGIDWVNLNNDMMVRDIRKPLNLRGYNTAICMGVLEHLEPEGIEKVLCNLAQCERQVLTVHSGPATSYPPSDLHLTQWSLAKWDRIIRVHFVVVRTVLLQVGMRKLYILENFPKVRNETRNQTTKAAHVHGKRTGARSGTKKNPRRHVNKNRPKPKKN